MVSLCAPVFDIAGSVTSISGAAQLQYTSRRASRVATLDGSAVLVDGGFSAADLTYKLQIPDSNGAHHLAITSMLSNHQTAVMSCDRGCYLVLLSNLTSDKGITICTAEVLEDLGA